MKITTLNFKHIDYLENHEIFVGTRTGTFKRVSVAAENPYTQQNLQDIKTLTKDSNITALSFSDENCNEILVGRENKYIQTFYTISNSYESVQEYVEGPIVGLAKYDEKIIAGIATGKIQYNNKPDSIIKTGDNISRMRQCPTDRNLVATGGKERQNNLKVFDVKEKKEIFKSKNVPNDFLQLEVPVWDSDLGFIDSNTIATCSRYGYIRVYDIRKQRRPILNYKAPEEQMSFCSLTTGNTHFIYCGSTMGIAKAFDIRKFKTFAHTYKGFTGSVSDLCLDQTGKYLISSCLDRYVRVHNSDKCVMLYQCYVKSKATRVIIKTFDNAEDIKKEEEDEEVADVSNVVEDKIENCSDGEYDAMFESMPKISETGETNGDDVISTKRKVTESKRNIKKKKTKKNM